MTDYKHYFKGFIGGITGILISHPIDTYRVNYQTFNKIKFSQLYRGVLPPLISVSIEKALVFGIFNNINNDNHFKSRNAIIEKYHPYNDGKSAKRMIEAVENYLKYNKVPKNRKISIFRMLKTFYKILAKKI